MPSNRRGRAHRRWLSVVRSCPATAVLALPRHSAKSLTASVRPASRNESSLAFAFCRTERAPAFAFCRTEINPAFVPSRTAQPKQKPFVTPASPDRLLRRSKRYMLYVSLRSIRMSTSRIDTEITHQPASNVAFELSSPLPIGLEHAGIVMTGDEFDAIEDDDDNY